MITPKHEIHVRGLGTVYVPPKCACRSVTSFLKGVQIKNSEDSGTKIVIFRNPFKRLISGYLNKYVEHTKYRQRLKNKDICETFSNFVNHIKDEGLSKIDQQHFSPQLKKYKNITVDKVFNADDLEDFGKYVNSKSTNDIEVPVIVWNYKKNVDEPENPVEDPFTLKRSELTDLINNKKVPLYSSFYTEEFKEVVKGAYQEDFKFIKDCLDRGVIEHSLYKELTEI